LTTETPQIEELREWKLDKTKKPKRIKTKQKKKTKSSRKQLLLVAIIVFLGTVLLAYDYQIIRETKINDDWHQRLNKVEWQNERLTRELKELQTELEILQNEHEETLKAKQNLEKKLEQAQIALKNPWINGSILMTYVWPTNINQIVTPIVIDFPEGLIFNTTILHLRTYNVTIFWTNQPISTFDGEIRYNVTTFLNPQVPSLEMLFSQYQAPEEIRGYLQTSKDYTCTKEELKELLALIEPEDTLGSVLLKTLGYAASLYPEANTCSPRTLKAVGLFRTIGIPSREAYGFIPDWPTEKVYKDYWGPHSAHAWVQVYVDGCWLDYNPSPVQGDAAKRLLNQEFLDDQITTIQQYFSVRPSLVAKTKYEFRIYGKTIAETEDSATYSIVIKTYPLKTNQNPNSK